MDAGQPRFEDCKILVVDDNVDAADTLVSLLGLLGFKAYAVYDGEQAVMASEVLKAKLIFLDIDMPGMDGYETAACIRRAEGREPVKLVALTARNKPVDRMLTTSVGFDLHVQKPIGSKQLARLAEQVCPRHSGLR
jgi:CheY-like chemotaxis protein